MHAQWPALGTGVFRLRVTAVLSLSFPWILAGHLSGATRMASTSLRARLLTWESVTWRVGTGPAHVPLTAVIPAGALQHAQAQAASGAMADLQPLPSFGGRVMLIDHSMSLRKLPQASRRSPTTAPPARPAFAPGLSKSRFQLSLVLFYGEREASGFWLLCGQQSAAQAGQDTSPRLCAIRTRRLGHAGGQGGHRWSVAKFMVSASLV